MKTTLFSIVILSLLFAGKMQGQQLKEIWETSPEILKTPESVLYDSGRDLIYVANINGGPSEKDGNGFISILNADGSLKTKNWVEGLNAPKGMALQGKKLYVSDIDELVVIDIEEAKVIERYHAPDAIFLNDVAICMNGMVFVSDTRTAKIHQLDGKNFTVWYEGDPLDSPNGLMTEKGHLYVGDLNIYKINISSKKIDTVVEDTGGVDGLEKNNDGNFVYSNWPGMIWIYKDGEKIKLHDSTEQKINTADIDFASKYEWILVPTFYDNRVVAYKLEN